MSACRRLAVGGDRFVVNVGGVDIRPDTLRQSASPLRLIECRFSGWRSRSCRIAPF